MLRSGGLPEAVFNLALDRKVQLYYSELVMDEYTEVLHRARLAIDPNKVANALARIRGSGLLVTPTMVVAAARDPDDNIFLECAYAAAAGFIVTGNIKDFPTEWYGTRIVTAREFLGVIAETPRSDP